MEYFVPDVDTYLKFVTEEIDQANYQKVEGNHYLEVLSAFHESLEPKTYLEIGISHGNSLKLANCRSIGIDPEPNLEGDFSNHIIYQKTSDLFFQEDACQLFTEEKIDLAFLDGMHLFEFALRDFINSEKYAHQNTYILIHDILPRCFSEAIRGRVTIDWTGDVWKLILALRKYRPDLNIIVLDAYPTGLAVVSGLDPDSDFLSDNYEDIVAELMAINTLSFIKARDLIMHTFSTELYVMNLMLGKS